MTKQLDNNDNVGGTVPMPPPGAGDQIMQTYQLHHAVIAQQQQSTRPSGLWRFYLTTTSPTYTRPCHSAAALSKTVSDGLHRPPDQFLFAGAANAQLCRLTPTMPASNERKSK
jgi:hypothetical protein